MPYVSVMFIILGFCAIVFKTYPSKNNSLKRLKDKYGSVDEKKLVLFEGVVYLISGLLLLGISIFDKLKYKRVSFVTIFILIIIAMAYYPMRKKFVGLK